MSDCHTVYGRLPPGDARVTDDTVVHSAGPGLLRQLQRAKRRICGGTWHQVISHPSQFQQDWIISYCQSAKFRSHKDMFTMTIMIIFCGYVHISIHIWSDMYTYLLKSSLEHNIPIFIHPACQGHPWKSQLRLPDVVRVSWELSATTSTWDMHDCSIATKEQAYLPIAPP